jgi:hypothetical protein
MKKYIVRNSENGDSVWCDKDFLDLAIQDFLDDNVEIENIEVFKVKKECKPYISYKLRDAD